MKLLTVIIPVRDREKEIIRLLDGIGSQTLDRVSVIVVNNASADSTAAVVREWISGHGGIDIRLISCLEPGAACARNAGLAMVETPFVMFFDSDDEMAPDMMRQVTDYLSGHPSAQILGWDVDNQHRDSSRHISKFPTRRFLQNHLVHGCLSTLRYACSTDLIRRAGGWNQKLTGWDDLELGVRLLLLRPEIHLLPTKNPPVKINYSENSITGIRYSDSPEKWETALDAIEETLRCGAPTMTRWITYRRAILAANYETEGDTAEAVRLFNRAVADDPFLARTVFTLHRHFHRGSWIAAALIINI